MGKGGMGVGSASIVLIFAVLCLTIFTIITYMVTNNERALIDAKAELIKGYYEADALAEQILQELLDANTTPDRVHGVNIETGIDEDLGIETTHFYCRITDIKSLYVKLAIREDSFDILSWRMYDTDEWVFDDTINVWTGD